MIDTFTMRELLKGDYRENFEKICLYGEMCNRSTKVYEDRITNIYDLFLEAQEEGKPVSKIVGNNLEKFCKSYFKYESNLDAAREVCKRILNIVAVLFVFSWVDYLFLSEEKVPLKDATVGIEGLFIGIVVGVALISYFGYVRKKRIFVEGNVKHGLYLALVIVILFVGVFGLNILLGDVINIQAPLLATVIITGTYIFIYMLVTMIYRLVNYKSLKNPNKLSKEEKAERDAANKEIEEKSETITTARDLSERYLKLKAKNKKKGKPEYTMTDFIKLIRKDISQEKGIKAFMIIMAVGSTCYSTFRAYGNDGIQGAILMFVILGIIMTFVCKFMWKILTEVNISIKQVIDTCEDRGISIDDYAKEVESMGELFDGGLTDKNKK